MAREAFRKGEETINTRVGDISMSDDPSIVRGVNQESAYRKGNNR